MRKRKQQSELVTGIDVGSSAVRVVVGQQTQNDHGQPRIQVISALSVPSEGVNKGIITSIEEVISSIANALEKTERTIGVPIEHAWVGVSGVQVLSQPSRGVISVTKPDGEISREDVERAVEAAKTIPVPINYELLHVVPKSFVIDGQSGIRDPIGMNGLRLELDTTMIYVGSSHIKNISKSVYRTGIDIDDLVLSALAIGDACASPKQKDLGVAVLSVGASTTTMIVYEDGDVQHIATLPVGAEHITNDLAIGLRTSIDVAERVKRAYGSCMKKEADEEKMIALSEFGGEPEKVPVSYVRDIVHARTKEIFEKVNEELASIDRKRKLPAGVVVTGGGANIEGIIGCAKEVLELPAVLGFPRGVDLVADSAEDLSYATAIAFLVWGSNMEHVAMDRSSGFGKAKQALSGLKKVGKWLMP